MPVKPTDHYLVFYLPKTAMIVLFRRIFPGFTHMTFDGNRWFDSVDTGKTIRRNLDGILLDEWDE